jgi:hypothetical protein
MCGYIMMNWYYWVEFICLSEILDHFFSDFLIYLSISSAMFLNLI